MTTFVPDMTGQESPDRLDACVWACTYLWGRASFSEVTTRWPNTAASDPAYAASEQARVNRRPGAMVRWHRGLGHDRDRSNT